MKIAHIVCSYPPYYGGMGNVVFETASHLSRLGHEVTVLTPGEYQAAEIKKPTEEPEAEHGEAVTEQMSFARRLTPRLQYGNAAYLPQIGRELDAFDLVHLHYPFFGTANLVRRWKLKNQRKPLVITYHMDVRGPGWKGLFFKYYAKYWMPKILASADRIIASSFDYIEASSAASLYRSNKDTWVELPFGVDADRFTPREKPLPLFNRHHLNPELPVLLFVGGMDAAHYFKGINVLLKALLFIKQGGNQLQTIFVGHGELQKTFESRAALYGLSDAIRFIGKVSPDELPYYYNMADLLALPSVNAAEAFGMVLLEAMSSGVPVVASDLPGVRTVAADGGILVTPDSAEDLAEAILGYFVKENNQAAWRERARSVVEEKYAWESIIGRLDGMYQSLVDRG